MKTLARYKTYLLLLAFTFCFVTTAERLKQAPRQSISVEMQVALPLFVQVLMSAGDRYLAANLATIRAMIVAPNKMQRDEFAILAKVQEDASWLNPMHEDGYYIAAAILPWYGEVDRAQTILARSSKARYFDYQPTLYYAFNQMHFRGDVLGAAAWMQEAALKLPDEDERLTMQNLAARWMDRSNDLDVAIRVVESMAKQAKRNDFKDYLEQRVVRLRMLKDLRQLAGTYQERYGHPPADMADLLRSGLLKSLPQDPFGFGFIVNKQGVIVLRDTPPTRP